MAWFAGQLVVLLAVAFLLGVLLGYLVWIFGWRRRVTDDVQVTTSTRELAAVPGGEHGARDAAIEQRDARIAELEDQLATEREQFEADTAAMASEREAAAAENAERVAELRDEIAALLDRRDADVRAERERVTAELRAARDERVSQLQASARSLRGSFDPADEATVIDVTDADATDEVVDRRAEGADEVASAAEATPGLTTQETAGEEPTGGEPLAPVPLAGGDRSETVEGDRSAATPATTTVTEDADAEVTIELDVAVEPDDVVEPDVAVELDVAVEPDDLTRVEGIGPKMQAALHDAGVLTFEQLAHTGESDIRAAIVAAGMSFAPSVPTWAKQARYLADGDEDGLTAYQDRLVAGRDEGAS